MSADTFIFSSYNEGQDPKKPRDAVIFHKHPINKLTEPSQ